MVGNSVSAAIMIARPMSAAVPPWERDHLNMNPLTRLWLDMAVKPSSSSANRSHARPVERGRMVRFQARLNQALSPSALREDEGGGRHDEDQLHEQPPT